MPDPRAIVLPVEIDLDSATGQLRTLKQVVSTEATQSAKLLEQSLAATERQAKASAGAAITWTDALKGANPAISGVTQAVRAMGAEVSPVLSGISHAIVSMISGGFTPLGLAVGVATGALMLWNSANSETASSAERATAAIDKQTDAFNRLIDARAEAALGRRATAAGRPAELLDVEEQAEELRRVIALRSESLRGATAPGQAKLLREEIDRAQSELDRLTIRYQIIQQRIGPASRSGYDPAYERARNDEVRRLMHPELFEEQIVSGATPEDYQFGPTDPAFNVADRATLDRQRRERAREWGQKDAEAYAEGFFAQQSREQEDRFRNMNGVESATPTGERVSGYIATNPQRVRTYAEELDRQFQASAESGLVSGIQAALTDPSNWRGALDSFARTMQQTITQRLAQGIADALLGHGENFGSAGLFGLFRGATATTGETLVPGATPGDTYNAEGLIEPVAGPAKMATRAQPIAVVNVWDEQTADSVAAKMSAGGARVVMARAMGGGVSAGTVPGRRGR